MDVSITPTEMITTSNAVSSFAFKLSPLASRNLGVLLSFRATKLRSRFVVMSGTAVATHSLSPSTRVIGVEPANADDAAQSFKSGHIVRLDNIDTIADGTRSPSVGVRNFALMKELVSDIVTVSEQDIADVFCLSD